MPLWAFFVGLAVNTVVSVGLALYAARRGAERSAEKAIAVYGEQIKVLQQEVVLLRDAKHTLATRVTEHEAWLDVLKRREGLGT